jgi:hypothetical protein
LNIKTKEDKYGQHGFSQFALKGSSLLYNAKNKDKKPFYEPREADPGFLQSGYLRF